MRIRRTLDLIAGIGLIVVSLAALAYNLQVGLTGRTISLVVIDLLGAAIRLYPYWRSPLAGRS